MAIPRSRATAVARGTDTYRSDRGCKDCDNHIRKTKTGRLLCKCLSTRNNAKAKAKKPPKPKKINYLSNKNLLAELEKCNEEGRMTGEFGKMMMMLTDRYGRAYNFRGYSYLDEMKGFAIQQCCTYWDRFDKNKSNNPFAYFTQVIKNAFIQEIKSQGHQALLRDGLLVEAGLEPSYNYGDKLESYEKRLSDNKAKFIHRSKLAAAKKTKRIRQPDAVSK